MEAGDDRERDGETTGRGKTTMMEARAHRLRERETVMPPSSKATPSSRERRRKNGKGGGKPRRHRLRYIHGLSPDADEQSFPPEASGIARGLGMDSTTDSTWRLMPPQVHSSSLLKPRNDPHVQGNSSQLYMPQAFEPTIDAAMLKQRQQHCFFGSEMGSPGTVKQEAHSMRPFLDEWPKARESWSDLDEGRSSKSAFSTTQLSISIPVARSEFSGRSACSPDGADA